MRLEQKFNLINKELSSLQAKQNPLSKSSDSLKQQLEDFENIQSNSTSKAPAYNNI